MTKLSRTIQYGMDRELDVTFQEGAHVDEIVAPKAASIDDVAAAVAAGLEAPQDFPPLAKAIVPGDRVVLAIEPETPALPKVVAGVVAEFSAVGVAGEDIEIVASQPIEESSAEWPSSELDETLAKAIKVSFHDPSDRDSLAYLAASKENRPVLINRKLFDADVVVPIGCARAADQLGTTGVYEGLFPAFSDEDTQKRFRTPPVVDAHVQHRLHRREAEEAAWLLGANLTVQVVPGAASDAIRILVGSHAAVAQESASLAETHWAHRLTRQYDLVVAVIGGPSNGQTWDCFARCLKTASLAVEDDGAILLCTQLSGTLGPGLQRLADAADDWSAIREIRHERPVDAAAACVLNEVQQRAAVYLLSDLAGDSVEALGMGHVEDAHGVERLLNQFPSCLLIHDAQRVVLQMESPT